MKNQKNGQRNKKTIHLLILPGLTLLSLSLIGCSHSQPKSDASAQAPSQQQAQEQAKAPTMPPDQLPPQPQSQTQIQAANDSPAPVQAGAPVSPVSNDTEQAGQAGQPDQLGKTQDSATTSPVQHPVIQTDNIPAVQQTQVKADINRMQAKDFAALGLSQDEAQKVVAYRNQNGPFHSVDDLQNVPGMDLGWLNDNRPKLGLPG